MKRSLVVGLAFGMLSSGQSLTIRLYNLAQVPAATVDRASAVAGQLLAEAGVTVIWQAGAPSALEGRLDDQSVPAAGSQAAPDSREYLVMRLARSVSEAVARGEIGYALPDAHQGAHATVYYDRVEKLYLSSSATPGIERLLGAAMAHEIGHVLLDSKEHSDRGIMKASWGPAELRLLAFKRLLFTTENSRAMRAGVYRRTEAVCPAGAAFLSSASINGFRNCN